MMHISIPNPCHEDWNEMTPNQQGRHCNVCCKTVVDFTSMNDEEVKYFFINKKKEETVCGRFKNEQLQRINVILPYNIYKLSMPLWKQFLTACLLAFSSMLFSCDAVVEKNNALVETVQFAMGKDELKTPLPPPPPVIFGVTMPQIDTTTKTTCSVTTGDTIYVESFTTGDISIAPVENITPTVVLSPVEEADTPQIIFTGKVAIDTNTIINPKTPDTLKTKNPPKADSIICENENGITL